MENTNISDSILETSSSMPSLSATSTSEPNGFFSYFKNINMTTWLIIILILTFLGFNIFVYLAQGTQYITDTFAPLLKKLFGITIATTSQTIDVAAEGAKKVVSKTSDAIETSLTAVQELTPEPNQSNSSIKGTHTDEKPSKDNIQENSLSKALNTSVGEQKQPQNDYAADYADSSIQGGGKSGWCYVGSDRGYRTCAEVGPNDSCMSGDIFPTHEICMNPNLRT